MSLTFRACFVITSGLLGGLWLGRITADDLVSRSHHRNMIGTAAAPADPAATLGAEACVKCHAAETQVWRTTPHAQTFEQLHRRPEAKAIVTKLRLTSIKHSGRCVACHYTQQAAGGSVHAIAGVSCESCHGAAAGWVNVHHDYGGPGVTRHTESMAHRNARLLTSIRSGMRNPVNVYLMAQSCLRCHTTADEQLVNVGGHSAGSLDFEFVSWSQGSIRHNFVRTDGQSNEVSDSNRIRVMFVAGMIAELESSLRATAAATQHATFGVTVAKRAARAAARLKSVQAKTNSPRLAQIIEVFDSVELALDNRGPLTEAADRIAMLGFAYADAIGGDDLAVLDPFIPAADRWK